MFLFRNRLAFGALFTIVFGAIKVALDIVYKLLKVLKLQFLASVLFIGAILFITKVMPKNTTVLIIFLVFVFFGVFYAVYGNVQRIKKIFSKKKRKENDDRTAINEEEIKEEKITEANEKKEDAEETYPKYYSVKQNSNYVMAEFKDRFELYVKKDGKLFKVRTDMKKESK